jgi:hypothetical protein
MNTYKILDGKPEATNPLGRGRWGALLKLISNKGFQEDGMDSTGSG